MSTSGIEIPGFADPVREGQTTFRAVLDAMAHPGRIRPAESGLTAAAPLHQATAAVALTLIDAETPLFLDAAMEIAGAWLAFHAGASIVDDAAQAHFVLASSLPDLAALRTGSDEAPEASATVILQLAALGSGTAYRLDGPGLPKPAILHAAGLPDDFVGTWRRNRALFPRGIDVILCAGDQLAALPRTVSVEQA
jgi:alpha-D-ribose 1-methylphosphonate 5-triphosphate synthase subunit PhnH